MKDQFVPFELAVKLKELGFDMDGKFNKELGFDTPCFARFRKGRFQLNTLGKPHRYNSDEIVKGDVSAPLWQQAFDFFDKLNIYSYIDTVSIGSDEWEYRYIINFLPKEFKDYKRRAGHFVEVDSFIEGFGTYTGAWSDKNKARQACLEKLIEIIS